MIGIEAAVARRPLRHHRAYGSVPARALAVAFVLGIDGMQIQFSRHLGNEPRKMLRWEPVL